MKQLLKAASSAMLGGVGALVCVAGVATPAAAHGGAQAVPDSAYYRAALVGLVAAPPGVSVAVDPAGEWIELVNRGGTEVVVLGYAGEPYLRVTPASVEENQLAESTYVNRNQFADALPAAGGSSVAPAWLRIGGNGAVRWHDHRIHWMGQGRPPAVAADPRHAHPAGDWKVYATADGNPFEIHGSLRWIGKPDGASRLSAVPAWALWTGESLVLVIAALALLSLHQRRRLRAPLTGAVGGLLDDEDAGLAERDEMSAGPLDTAGRRP